MDFLCTIEKPASDIHISEGYHERVRQSSAKPGSRQVLSGIVEDCKNTIFIFHLFVDENHAIYNCGTSGYFKEIKWCLKHDTMQNFENWLSSSLAPKPKIVEMVKAKLIKKLNAKLNKILPSQISHSIINKI